MHEIPFLFRFWSLLTTSSRRQLCLDYGLIDDEDIGLREDERYHKALIKAKDQGKLELIMKAIHKYET